MYGLLRVTWHRCGPNIHALSVVVFISRSDHLIQFGESPVSGCLDAVSVGLEFKFQVLCHVILILLYHCQNGCDPSCSWRCKLDRRVPSIGYVWYALFASAIDSATWHGHSVPSVFFFNFPINFHKSEAHTSTSDVHQWIFEHVFFCWVILILAWIDGAAPLSEAFCRSPYILYGCYRKSTGLGEQMKSVEDAKYFLPSTFPPPFV